MTDAPSDPLRDRKPDMPKAGARFGKTLGIFCLIIFGLLAGVLGYFYSGQTVALPTWALNEIEAKLNQNLTRARHLPDGTAISIGSVDLGTDQNLSPHFTLRNLALKDESEAALVQLPEVNVAFDGRALLSGEIRPSSLQLRGAHIAVARDENGLLTLRMSGLSGAPQNLSAAGVFDALDEMFDKPILSKLKEVQAEGLTLVMEDARAKRRWQVGDGRLVLRNQPDQLSSQFSMTLLSQDDRQPTSAQASLAWESKKSDSSAKLWAQIDHLPAEDLALQSPAFAFLSIIDAPISAELLLQLGADGNLGEIAGQLSLGAGALSPQLLRDEAEQNNLNPIGQNLKFERAALSIRYNPDEQRITLDDLNVESQTIRLKASGSADLLDASGKPSPWGQLPHQLSTQLQITNVMVDPDGLFERPVQFSEGSAQYRLQFDPFKLELGQASLRNGDEHIRLKGKASLDRNGWDTAVDVTLNQISAEQLIQLWPLSAVPNTRQWLSDNVGQGRLSDVSAALRLRPNQEPKFALDYQFSEAQVRFLRTLPPVSQGFGRSTIVDNLYTLVLEGGNVIAPKGGAIDVTGSTFQVLDITQHPAQAEVNLLTNSSLEAALSLLDQAPFHFITKAGQTPDLGQGQAKLHSVLRFPLINKLQANDVFFDVTGEVYNFNTQKLVRNKTLSAKQLTLAVNPRQLEITGTAELDQVPITAKYQMPLGKDQAGKATVTGSFALSAPHLQKLGIAIPQGWISGSAPAQFSLTLNGKDAPILDLNSNLKGLGLSIDALSYNKAQSSSGQLSLSATLNQSPNIRQFTLSAQGLEAKGQLTTKADQSIDRITLSKLAIGKWLDVTATLTGQGKNAPLAIALTGGVIDMRARSTGGQSTNMGGKSPAASPYISVNLDQIIISQTIRLNRVTGRIRSRNHGLDGHLDTALNGAGRIAIDMMPDQGSTAYRITSQNAGQVIAAAGIFKQGRGGSLDMVLRPLPLGGGRKNANGGSASDIYRAHASFRNLSVQNAPALAELVAAASVVGLFEQMQGQGIVFNEGDVTFDLLPQGVQIRQGAAVGAALGLSFEGIYRHDTNMLDIQGTISPVYLLNGVGAMFSRKGEGLFGFSYHLSGTAAKPKVSVNPLSILTPGKFRDIFRRPVPQLRNSG